MIRRELEIGRWRVAFLFAKKGYDEDEVLDELYDCGASDYDLRQVKNLFALCEYNCGFTFANPMTFEMLVFIGPTTTGAEFIDTLVHELHHMAVAIAENLGMDLDGEGPAYLAGDSSRELVEVICDFGCSRCRHEKGRH